MNLLFDTQLAEEYTSQSQKIRVLTEDWADRQIYCPHCGQATIEKYANNKPVADFYCGNCNEDYELKSKQKIYETRKNNAVDQ
jgi:transposase-like protein